MRGVGRDGIKTGGLRVIVFVSSPYRGDIPGNVERTREYCRREIEAGNAPIAPHIMYPGVIDDDDIGIGLGLRLLERCDELHIYGEPSDGMRIEIHHAHGMGIPIREMRND